MPRKLKLVFAASARCPCGLGLAYAPGADYWDCAGIIQGTANPKVTHTAKLPFTFYEVKSEDQPSARAVGASTRDCEAYAT